MSLSAFDRRNFAKRMVGATIAMPLAGSAMPAESLSAEPMDNGAAATAPEPPREEDLYLALVSRLDTAHLRPEHLEEIRNEIAAHLARSRRLSAFPLTNADEPAPVYSAYRAED